MDQVRRASLGVGGAGKPATSQSVQARRATKRSTVAWLRSRDRTQEKTIRTSPRASRTQLIVFVLAASLCSASRVGGTYRQSHVGLLSPDMTLGEGWAPGLPGSTDPNQRRSPPRTKKSSGAAAAHRVPQSITDGGHRFSPPAAIGSPHGRPSVLPTDGHRLSPRTAIGSPHCGRAVSRSGEHR